MRVSLFEIWKHGGTAEYASNLSRALTQSAETGSSVSLVGPRGLAGASENVVLPDLTGGQSAAKAARAARYALQWARQQLTIVDAIRKTRPDVAHFLGTAVASPVVYAICRMIGVRTVVTVHDLPVKHRETPLGLRVTSSGFENADRILVHGEWTRDALGDQYGASAKARTSIIPFGIPELPAPGSSGDEIRARHGIPSNARVVLFFGSVRSNKGLDILIDALGQVADDRLWLVVAGQSAGRSEASVESYGSKLDPDMRKRTVWITQFIPDHEIPEIFAMSDVLVLPYRSSFASQSAVLGMAIAVGIPVIATRAGEIGPTVARYGLGRVVDPDSAPALSQALRAIAHGQVKAETSGVAEAREDMSWKTSAAAHWREYRALLSVR